MAKQAIGIGAAPNDGTGDTLRDAGDKINDNFTELYDLVGGATMTASADIAAGDFVNIHDSGGAKIRKADADDGTKPADGYAPDAILTAADGVIYGPGSLLSGLSGLTPGSSYYLSTAAGTITDTPPSSDGNLVQYVGRAVSATELFFNPQPGVTL